MRNNHIIARLTAENRTDGLFGFNETSDFSTFRFENNGIEFLDKKRSLFRNDSSEKSTVDNNRLTGVSEPARYANAPTKQKAGLGAPLKLNDEMTVDGWKATLKKQPKL